ncbi:coiled-coil domain-containing protein 91-like [Pecten maximus]|uniref:coiled-coil domain-containing protein 91-like n=1 Tax=Pecten maximus TaxID=6579 RepID=UPI0014585B78|nr:coiled-coil domain-containing protein 91-like [Pecten maximus]
MMDDDDFDDFGGFEAAEPVPQAPVPTASQGQEASPSPWALITSGYSNVGAKPDLLCRENKFPEVLDPTVTRSQGVSSQDQNGSTGQHIEEASGSSASFQAFEAEFPTGANDSLDVNLDEVTLANNILDGQFLPSFPASSQRSPNTVSSSQSNRPSLASSVSQQSSIDSQKGMKMESVVPPESLRQNSAQGQNHTDPALVERLGVIQNLSQIDQVFLPQSNSGRSRASNSFSSDRRSSSGIEPAAERKTSVSSENSFKQDTWESDLFSTVQTSVARTTVVSKETSGTRLSSSPSSILSSMTAPTTKRQEETSVPNQAVIQEMKQIRSESQAAVKSVVQEYKDMMQTTIRSERETMEGQVRVLIQEQEDKFKSMLSEQRSHFEEKLAEERIKMAESKNAALKEKAEELQKEFEDFLKMEREKNQNNLQSALEEERLENSKKVMEALEQEREKNRKQHLEQKELFRKELQEQQQKHEDIALKSLADQREKFQVMLKETLEEERRRGEEALRIKVEQIESKKMLDNKVHRRHMASLDVFLEGARQQLSLLMDKSDSSDVEMLPLDS